MEPTSTGSGSSDIASATARPLMRGTATENVSSSDISASIAVDCAAAAAARAAAAEVCMSDELIPATPPVRITRRLKAYHHALVTTPVVGSAIVEDGVGGLMPIDSDTVPLRARQRKLVHHDRDAAICAEPAFA